MLFIIQEISHVQIPILIDLNSRTMLLVVTKLPFIEFAFLGNIDSSSHFFLLANFPKVYFTIGFDEFQVIGKKKGLNFEGMVIWEKLVWGKKVTKFWLIEGPYFTEKSFFFGCMKPIHLKVKLVFLKFFGLVFGVERYLDLWVICLYLSMLSTPHNKII